jgi:GNAT superfamily N-acetyltransferase
MPIQINPIILSEVEELMQMIEDFYAIEDYQFDKETARNAALQIINNNQFGEIYFIQHHTKIIGYFILTFGFSFEHNGRVNMLEEIYIIKIYRNKGIGKLAIEFILQRAKTLGINAVNLEVEIHNETANILYQKSGFESYNRILMTKKISD